MAAERRTSTIGRTILSLAIAMAILVPMYTTVGYLADTARAKEVTFSLGGLFPMITQPKGTWDSPDMAILVSMARFGNYIHTHLYLVLANLSELINSRIKWILWLKNPF